MKNILSPLIDACQWILEFWHDLVGGSWGWSIILLTFTVRLFILPLTFRGVKSMQRLQSFQPEIKAIQERYKDDRQRMNQEVMAFYQREKVNPLGSCLPLVLQIPFFISLFYLLRSPEFKADIAGNASFGADPQPGREDHRRAGPARHADRPLRGHAAGRERGHGVQRRPDPAPDHVRDAVRVHDLHRELPGRADRVLDHHERLDDRPAAFGQEALSKAGASGRRRRCGRRREAGARQATRAEPAGRAAAATDGGGSAKASGGNGGNGGPVKAPPQSPRKKKKRSGRRR